MACARRDAATLSAAADFADCHPLIRHCLARLISAATSLILCRLMP